MKSDELHGEERKASVKKDESRGGIERGDTFLDDVDRDSFVRWIRTILSGTDASAAKH